MAIRTIAFLKEYPLLYEAACKNVLKEGRTPLPDRQDTADVSSLFSWAITPEGGDFWSQVSNGVLQIAIDMKPHLFGIKPKEKVPIKVKAGEYVVTNKGLW